jgi:hypothetical protein
VEGGESKATRPAAGWTLEEGAGGAESRPTFPGGVESGGVFGAKTFAAAGFGSSAQAIVWRLALTSKPSRAVLAIVFIDLPDLAT